MKTELEEQDIEIFANRVAKILHEKQQDDYNTSLMDTKALAKYLSVPKSWVYEKTRDKGHGSIPRVKVGRYLRFNIKEVLEWLERQ